MPSELSPAEQAAAEALQYICWHTGPSTDPTSLCGECDKAARAVVAAVRGPLYRRAAERLRKDWPKSPHVARKLEQYAEEAEGHGPDWTDSMEGEGPSCACGFNGTPEECQQFRAAERQAEGSTDE